MTSLRDAMHRPSHLSPSEANRLEAFDARSGADQVRQVRRIIDSWNETFMDPFSFAQLHQLVRMHVASDWDYYPDEWADQQVHEALVHGYPPRWADHDMKAVYR